MTDLKQKSIGELEGIYKRQLATWKQRKRDYEQKVVESEQQIAACEAKLRHIQALTSQPKTPKVASATSRKTVKRKRRRKSPVREATLQALRNRPGQRLTTKQLMSAIRADTRKKVSRQSINVNVGILEKDGLIRRDPAPRGSGARFVYWAV